MPPRVASVLVRLSAGRDNAPFVLSDLREEFDARVTRLGRRRATVWYWQQAVSSLWPLMRSRLRGTSRYALSHKLRDTARQLRRAPGTAAVLVLTLALGIGANAAVFSVVDAVLLRPLPYRAPAQLLSVWETSPAAPRMSVSPGDYLDYRARSSTFEDLGAVMPTELTLHRAGGSESLTGEMVSWNLLAVLGSAPAIGRGFLEPDGQPGAPHVVILTDSLWRTQFNADPAILGDVVTLDRQPYVVVGIMAPAFRPLFELATSRPASFLVPAPLSSALSASREHELKVVGRLRAGVTRDQARLDLNRVAAGIAREFPESNAKVGVGAAPLAVDIVSGVRTPLLAILAAVALVALIACVNVVNLLVVWALDHEREVAIRLALGANRADIFSDFLVRGLVLAVLGGAVGLVAGTWVRNLLMSFAPVSLRHAATVQLDVRVLTLTAAVAFMAGLAAGIVPALAVSRPRLAPALGTGERAGSSSAVVSRWQSAFLVAEIGAAVVLALGAGLLTRSLLHINRIDLGYRTADVVTMAIDLPGERYPDATSRLRFFQDLETRLGLLPGVDGTAFANQFPMRGGWSGQLQVNAANGPRAAEADLQAVSTDYFATLGMPLVRGRLFGPQDRPGAPGVVVVSETFARTLLGSSNPIGATIQRGPTDPTLTIVGVVGEVRRDGKFDGAAPQVYFSATQVDLYRARLEAIAFRAAHQPMALMPSVRREVAALDPELTVVKVASLEDLLVASVATRRFAAWLFGAFAALAGVLAVIGVYGLVAHTSSKRVREIGIRLALGSTEPQVTRLILRFGLQRAIAGITLGLAAAAVASRSIAALLFEVAPIDPLSFVVVGIVMLLVSTLASYLPVRRIIAASPIAAVRSS